MNNYKNIKMLAKSRHFFYFFFPIIGKMGYNVFSLVGGNMEIIFSSKEELYNRVKPALNAKAVELHRLGYSYIQAVDIWNYLIENVWSKSKDLMLSDIVNDIFQVKNKEIDIYLKKSTAHDVSSFQKTFKMNFHKNYHEFLLPNLTLFEKQRK